MKNTVKFAIGTKVVKESANKNEYWEGIIRATNTNKALVYFPTREISRWCNVNNLIETTERR